MLQCTGRSAGAAAGSSVLSPTHPSLVDTLCEDHIVVVIFTFLCDKEYLKKPSCGRSKSSKNNNNTTDRPNDSDIVTRY
jgi:hypothetical protein